MSAQAFRVYFQLQRTAVVLKQTADSVLRDAAGITTSQAAVLAVIGAGGPRRQNALAEELAQKEAAVTQMLMRLETRGLVSRQRSAQDRRASEVKMTPAGREALHAARLAFERINARLDTALAGDAQAFAARLEAIRQAVGDL